MATHTSRKRCKKGFSGNIYVAVLFFALSIKLSMGGCASMAANESPHNTGVQAVEIGGMEQWILVRGNTPENPVLLWVHGGPGAAQMPVARYGLRELEEHFIVVHWDQRGAGKSNPPEFDVSTMSIAQFVSDLHELTAYLRVRFGERPIYLLGHSWGSELGLQVIADRPDEYAAWIGVSQVVNRRLGEQIAHEHLAAHLAQNGSRREQQRLETLGPPPYIEHERYVEFMGLLNAEGSNVDVPMWRLALHALRAPEYRVRDYKRWLNGAQRGSGPMWNEAAYAEFDARTAVPRIEVPAYFIMGAKDYNTPTAAVQQYLEVLDAPAGKELIVFPDAAHTPFFQDPDRFVAELVRIKSTTTY